MKTKMKTCFAMVAAGGLLALSAGAIAQDGRSAAVELNDAQLDQITAGAGAVPALILFVPGNANVRKDRAGTHDTCVGCDPFEVQRPFGVIQITKPDGTTVQHLIGRWPPL